jgi:hypothetical protein
MSTTQTNYGVISKVSRTNVKKVFAESLKPPQEEIDESGAEDHKYFLVYVANGQEVRARCTHDVWKRALGPKSVPGRKVPGWDNKIHNDFYIIIDTKTKMITDVDMLPKNRYERGMVPEDQEGKHTLEIKINQKTGGMEILSIPPKLRSQRILAILNEIDKLTVIEPGAEISGCEATSVGGNIVVLEVPQERN